SSQRLFVEYRAVEFVLQLRNQEIVISIFDLGFAAATLLLDFCTRKLLR
ncbi:hypothetical protein LINPERPRIM_LOCUS6593, partial [Linum perenne]